MTKLMREHRHQGIVIVEQRHHLVGENDCASGQRKGIGKRHPAKLEPGAADTGLAFDECGEFLFDRLAPLCGQQRRARKPGVDRLERLRADRFLESRTEISRNGLRGERQDDGDDEPYQRSSNQHRRDRHRPSRFKPEGSARDRAFRRPRDFHCSVIGGFDRGSARQRQAANNTGHGCIDRNIGLREHRARVVLDDGDACIFHFDHHATERSVASVVEQAVERAHSDTSTSNKSLTSEPVAVANRDAPLAYVCNGA